MWSVMDYVLTIFYGHESENSLHQATEWPLLIACCSGALVIQRLEVEDRSPPLPQ